MLKSRAFLGGAEPMWADGQRNLAVTAHTYSHVLADETELDYAGLRERA